MTQNSKKCTIYRNIFEISNPKYIMVDTALKRIKEGASKDMIEKLRAEPDKDKRGALKKLLPCVVFAGVFTERKDSKVVEYSNLIVLDFDDVDVGEKIMELQSVPFVYAAWRSPSGNGVKALVRIADARKHAEHFDALKKRFPELDASGRNLSRVCYESYDEAIYINKNAEVYSTVIQTETKFETKKTTDNEIYENLKTWLNNKAEAFVKGNRNAYVFKLASACCRYGMSEYETIRLVSNDFSHDGFAQKEIENSVKSAFRSNKAGTASFDKERLVTTSTQKEVDVVELENGFDEFVHVIFGHDVEQEAKVIYDRGYEKLFGINAPTVDYHYKMKRREVSLFAGYGNMGKSTFMLWLLLNRAVLYDEKFAIYSPESTPAEEFYFELTEMLAGADCSHGSTTRPDYETFKAMYKFVSEHFFFVYPTETIPSLDALKGAFLELIIKHKVDGCVIDPFNQMYHDRGKMTREDLYLEVVLSDITRFAEQNDIYFLIVAHPNGSVVVEKGEYREPNMYSISGGAMWANKMYNIIFYHRPFALSDKSCPLFQIITEKIKKQKIVGKRGAFNGEYLIHKRRFMIPSFNSVTGVEDMENQYDPLGRNMKISKYLKLPEKESINPFEQK